MSISIEMISEKQEQNLGLESFTSDFFHMNKTFKISIIT